MRWENFPPLTIFLCGVMWVLLLLLMVIRDKRIKKLKEQKKAEEAKTKNPEVQFLEDALSDDAPRKGNPNYSYAEFQRDLHDKGLTFEEIYEKCGGVFPKKPEPGAGHQGPSGLSGLQGPDGGPPSGPDGGRCPPRMKELQEWFKERGKTSHVGGLVPPPPNPYPIIHKIYIRGRR